MTENGKKKRKLLITGCGRSGTQYTATLLRENGIDIQHEKEGNYGVSSWFMTVLDGNPPFGPSRDNFEFEVILHQVRNPLDVIASVQTMTNESWVYIQKYIPIQETDSMLLRSMKYWYYWNLLAKKVSQFTYRIEDIDSILPKILDIVKIGNLNLKSLEKIPRNVNTRNHQIITLDDIKKEDNDLSEKIVSLANKYGYKFDTEKKEVLSAEAIDNSIEFSIIMATYNRKHCIKGAIDSLLVQTYINFELIIIDDGSTDETEKYITQIYKKELEKGKIRFFRLTINKGASFARNEGLKYTQNEWIAYLDSDNEMKDNFLETFAKKIHQNPYYQIFYGQLRYKTSGAIIGQSFSFDKLIQFNFIDLGVFVHNKSLYYELGGFDTNITRLIDWDIIIRYTSKYKPFFIEKILLDYYDGSNFPRITESENLDENYKQVIINYLKNVPSDKFISIYNKNAYDIDEKTKNIFEIENKILNEQLIQQRQVFFDQYTTLQKELVEQVGILNQKDILLREKEEEKINLIKKYEEQISIQTVEKDNIIVHYNNELATRDSNIVHLQERENQQLAHLQSKEQNILGLSNQISELSNTLSKRDNEVLLMQSSKFWKIRNLYLRSKWAILNPLKFIKKYTKAKHEVHVVPNEITYNYFPTIDVICNMKIKILASVHSLYIAQYLKYILSRYSINAEIVMSVNDQDNQYLYFVLCPNIHEKLPKHYVAYQMEQSNNMRWFTEDYFNKLKNSICIFDYSLTNIEFLLNNNFSYKNLYFMPLGFLGDLDDTLREEVSYEYDVLFYGDTNSPRRQRILTELSKKFKIKIICGVFGEILYKELQKAKLVINIHFYENGLLETTRLFECLSQNKLIISEIGSDQNIHSSLQKLIDFVDFNDIQGFIERINFWLQNDQKRYNKIVENRKILEKQNNLFYIGRFLLNYDFINFNTFYNITHSSWNFSGNMATISLIETVQRRQYITDVICSNLKEKTVNYFDGIRKPLGHNGCGMSFKYLIKKAKEQNLENVVIFEDDVEFFTDTADRLDIISEYANDPRNKNKWDIISGYMSEFNDEYEIKKIFTYKGVTFIETNKIVSDVFNIYNKSVYDRIINWNELDTSLDNIIDQYLKRKSLKILLVFPFLVGHKNNLASTLWTDSTLKFRENSLYSQTEELTMNYISQKINNAQVVRAQLSKILKWNDMYTRSKWAILNPLKFIKKYVWNEMPTYSQVLSLVQKSPKPTYVKTNQEYIQEVFNLQFSDVQIIEFKKQIKPKVSIIIPVYNKWQFTYNCLEALKKNTNNSVNFEIIIVDNASIDDTRFLLKKIKNITYVRNNKNLGFSKACNQGAKSAKGEYLLFLNNDTVPLSDWLLPLVRELENNKQIGIVGSKLLYPNNTIQHAGIILNKNGYPDQEDRGILNSNDSSVNIKKTFLAVTGACLMIRKNIFRKVKGFDEEYKNGFEDVDLCLKVGIAGFSSLYCPDSCLYHYESITEGRFDHIKHNMDVFERKWKDADILKRFKKLQEIPTNYNNESLFKKEIIFVGHDADFAGAQFLALSILKELKENFKFTIHLIIKSGGVLEKEYAKYAIVYNLAESYKEKYQKKDLIKLFKSLNINYAIANTVVSGSVVEILHNEGIKVVSLVHEMVDSIKKYNWINNAKIISQKADYIVFPSKTVKNEFVEMIPIFSNKIKIRPQGLLRENIYKNNIREARDLLRKNLNLEKDSFIVLGVGYADLRKGIDIFLEVALKMQNSYINFVWVGDVVPEMQSFVNEKIKDCTNVFFIKTTLEISVYYAGADLYLLTSREDPFPSVVIESMSVGVPVVGFDGAGGFIDIVTKETGVLIPYLDIDIMVREVGKLIKDKKRREILGNNCISLVKTKLVFKDYILYLLNLLGLN